MSYGHGGPDWGPGGQGFQPATPDWEALADEAAAARARRRRWLFVGGGALATLAVAAIVTIAVMAQDGGSNSSSGPEASGSPTPEPTFSDVNPPPPPDPRDYITDPEKDTAPLTPDTLFTDGPLRQDGRGYDRGPTDTTRDCASGVVGDDLRELVRKHNCSQLLRATYTRGDVAVTIGVAVFDSQRAALDTADMAGGGTVRPLYGKGVDEFCEDVPCRPTAYAIGRYAYFTIAGYTNGKGVTKGEKKALTAGRDASDFAYQRIMHRGRTQASAAATALPE